MIDDGDRLLNVVGAALVVALVVVIAVGIVIAVNVPANEVDPPDAEWTFEQVNATHVRIAHDAGESVAGSALIVTVDGYSRHPSWPSEVTVGEAVAVEAARGQVVRLYWDGGRTDRVQLASRYGARTRTPNGTVTVAAATTDTSVTPRR